MAVAIDTLAYARRLREAGFSERQAEGQAEALAAAMTDTLATKQDLREMEARTDARFAAIDARFVRLEERFDRFEKHIEMRLDEREKHIEMRLEEREKHTDVRLDERDKRLEARIDEVEKRLTIRIDELEKRIALALSEQIANLDRRMTVRMLSGIAAVAALVKLL